MSGIIKKEFTLCHLSLLGAFLLLIGVGFFPIHNAFAETGSGITPPPPPNQCNTATCTDCWFNLETNKCEGSCNASTQADCMNCLCKQYTVGKYSQCYCLK